MILVTGGTGFLGSELLRQLTEGGTSSGKVRAIRRESSKTPEILSDNRDIEWVTADVLDYASMADAMEGVSKVYHCAAVISFDPADEKMMRKVNIEGTANIVNLCFERDVKKLVHVSSVAALGKAKAGELVTETDAWEFGQSDGYAFSKYESEMEVWRAVAEGIHAVIVNPSIIIGKNAGSEGSGALFDKIKGGIGYYPTGGFGFVDVEDVASIMINLMESSITDENFILNSENLSYQDLFAKTALQLGQKPPAFELKPWMLGLAWRGAKLLSLITGKSSRITKATARSASSTQAFSNAKIKNTIEINFKPINQSIAEICAALNTSQA